MPEWTVVHRDHDGATVGEYKPANDINLSVNKNAPSSWTYDIARSDVTLYRDAFAPYRTDSFLYRDDVLVLSGPHTSRSWDSQNEGVISVGALDWMHLLEKLYFPMPITANKIDVDLRKIAFYSWGMDQVGITDPNGVVEQLPTSLDMIVRKLCEVRNEVDDVQWSTFVMPGGGNIPVYTPYQIAGLDGKSFYNYLTELSEMQLGFDFDVRYNGHNDLRIRLWHPTRQEVTPSVFFHDEEQFATFKWTDEGPIAARTYGLGPGSGTVTRVADVSVYTPSEEVYRPLEQYEDFSDLTDYYQYDMTIDEADHIIDRLTGAAGHRNRGPRHNVECSFLTSVLGFNFWTQMHPGTRINIDIDFEFHRVDHDYVMLGYDAVINSGGDETITPELQRIASE